MVDCLSEVEVDCLSEVEVDCLSEVEVNCLSEVEVDCLSEVKVECPDRARAGVVARLEETYQELDWIGWDRTNVHITDLWWWYKGVFQKQEVAQGSTRRSPHLLSLGARVHLLSRHMVSSL